MSSPIYLYKILDVQPPSPLPTTLPTTELDAKDGFIHLSTAAQIPTTAQLFFSRCSRLWILQLRTEDLDGVVKYSTDPAAGVPDGCAHVHDSKTGLGSGNVEIVIEASRNGAEGWTEVSQLKNLRGD